jgi:hypothetical protein
MSELLLGRLAAFADDSKARYFINASADYPIRDLPKTFQDAMKIITKLQIRYIWIDSLFIRYFDLCSTEHLITLLPTDHPRR